MPRFRATSRSRKSLAPASGRRARSAHRRYREGAASDLSRGSAAGGDESLRAWSPEAPTSRARGRERRQSCPRPCRPQTPCGPSASGTTRSRTPRCRSACRRSSRAPARDSCRPPSPGSGLRVCPPNVTVGERDSSSAPIPAACPPSPGRSRAPSRRHPGVTTIFAGFRSRWTIPFSCAASSASAICRAIASASRYRQRAGAQALRQRLPLDELEDQRVNALAILESVDGADVRMIQARPAAAPHARTGRGVRHPR